MQVENNKRISDAIFVEQLETKENHEEILWCMYQNIKFHIPKPANKTKGKKINVKTIFEELIWGNEW